MKHYLLQSIPYLLIILAVILLTSICQAGAPETEQPAATEFNSKPQIALIMDDMGYNRVIGNKLLDMDLNLTFSFLPQAPFTLELEKKAYLLGRDILVHLPMEALDPKWDPGPGGMYLSIPTEELADLTRKNMASVPHAIGANNHMGSRFTANRPAMHTVLSELKKRNFFFVDSVTGRRTIAQDEAKKMGIKTNRRHIFIDNVKEKNEICKQLGKLVSLAQRQGQAIGLGHPHKATLDALNTCRPEIFAHVQIVPLHELVQ